MTNSLDIRTSAAAFIFCVFGRLAMIMEASTIVHSNNVTKAPRRGFCGLRGRNDFNQRRPLSAK